MERSKPFKWNEISSDSRRPKWACVALRIYLKGGKKLISVADIECVAVIAVMTRSS